MPSWPGLTRPYNRLISLQSQMPGSGPGMTGEGQGREIPQPARAAFDLMDHVVIHQIGDKLLWTLWFLEQEIRSGDST